MIQMTDDLDGLTIGGLLSRAARLWPDQTAIVHDESRLTWAELDAQVDDCSRAFIHWGLQPGDRVSLWMGNTLEWPIIALAVMRVGGVIVPINTALTVPETSYIVGQSDSVLLISTDELRGRDMSQEALEVLKFDGVVARELIIVGKTPEGASSFTEFLEQGRDVSNDSLNARVEAVKADDTTLMLYTSGTTGFPKGVMHSHRVIWNMDDAADRMRLSAADKSVMYLPLFHIFAFAALVTFMSRGATLILLEVYEGERSLDLMEREQVTIVYGVAPHYLDQIRHPSYEQRDLSSIRMCLSPGTPDLVRLVSEKMGPAVNVYGMTETTSMTSLGDLNDPIDIRAETVGRTLPRSTVRVVDELGNDVPAGVVGELLVKGPPVAQGYYKNEKATSAAIVDGWFHTGDALSIDSNGYLRFVGRISEMFKVGGENVDPIEVETVLMKHPAVAFASVQPVDHERLGEVGLAHVTLVDGMQLEADELRTFARKQLAAFKIPRHIEIVEELPMTASGKVRKYLLREEFLARR